MDAFKKRLRLQLLYYRAVAFHPANKSLVRVIKQASNKKQIDFIQLDSSEIYDSNQTITDYNANISPFIKFQLDSGYFTRNILHAVLLYNRI